MKAKPQESSWWSTLFTLLCVGAGVGFLRNFLADEPELEEAALRVACGGADVSCGARTTYFERSAVGRSWQFELHGDVLAVRCERPYVVLGDYACKKSKSLLVGSLAPASASASASAPAPASASALPPAVRSTRKSAR